MNSASLQELQRLIAAIDPVDPAAIAMHQRRLDTLTKPLGSLGLLETTAARFNAICEGRLNLPLRKAVYVFAADHGVVAEGVSAYPQIVTAQMVANFLGGGAAINVLCRAYGVELTVVDAGVCVEFKEAPGLERRKVRSGTANMLREAAMSLDETLQAIRVGYIMTDAAAARGVTLLAAGEMGIGNTTAASAIAAALTGHSVAAVTGRGTGLTAAAVANKCKVIEGALTLHFPARPEGNSADPLEVLRCMGGLEIAAITGMILRAASLRVPVMLDGFIVTAAAAIAVSMAPFAAAYLFAGHCSDEPGHRLLLEHLGLTPLLTLGMRLGEGTGAVLAMPLLEAALRLSAEMATFDNAGVTTASQ